VTRARIARVIDETRHAHWERLAARTRHELGVAAGLSTAVGAAGRPRVRLVVGCRCGWEIDEHSASPREDARAHVAEGRHVA